MPQDGEMTPIHNIMRLISECLLFTKVSLLKGSVAKFHDYSLLFQVEGSEPLLVNVLLIRKYSGYHRMRMVRSLCAFLIYLIGISFFLLHVRTTSTSSPTHGLATQVSHASADSSSCGIWQADYIALHRGILNGTLPPRYFVSVAVEAGLADRLTGTLTEFFLALFTRRAFQIITYGTLPRFEAAFLAPNIN